MKVLKLNRRQHHTAELSTSPDVKIVIAVPPGVPLIRAQVTIESKDPQTSRQMPLKRNKLPNVEPVVKWWTTRARDSRSRSNELVFQGGESAGDESDIVIH